MLSSSIARYVRPAYGGPACDHAGSVGIGVRFVTARATPKLVLGLAILFCYVPAFGTFPASIARVDGDQQNASNSGLVFEEQKQLRERPGMQNSTLFSPGLDPLADTGKVFQFEPALGAFSFGNDLLGNTVVDMRGEPSLTPGEFLQFPLGRASLFLLKFGPQLAMPAPDGLNFASAMPLAVRRGCDVGDAKVHSEEFRWSDRRVAGKIYCAVQVELPLSVNQIGLPLDAVEPLALVLAVEQGNDNAAFWQRPKTNLVHTLEAEDALIVSDGPVGLEDRADCLVPLKALDGFADSTYCHLCGQSETGANFSVGQFVDRRLTKELGVKAEACRKGGGFIGALHGFEQPLRLCGVRQNLQLERQFHYSGVYISTGRMASGNRRPLRSPRYPSAWLKPAVSRAGDL